jgi:hypothetical protein
VVTIHRSAKDHSLFLTSFLDLLDLHRLSGTETDAEVLNPFVAVLVKASNTCCCTCGCFRYCECASILARPVDLLLLKGFLPFFSDFLCADPPGPFLLSRRRPLHILAVQCTNRNTGGHKGFAKSNERQCNTTLPSHLATFEGFGPHEQRDLGSQQQGRI